MANDLNISIRLNDEITKNLKNTSDALDDFGKVAKNVGRELSQVGQTFSLLGASISGPFIVALSNSAKSSAAVSQEFRRLQSVTNQFQTEIAQAVVPVFEKFNDILNGLLQRFNALDPAIRNQILQGVFLSGIFLTLGGIMTVIIGKTISLAANIMSLAATFLKFAIINPVMVAIAASIVVMVGLMFKFKGVADIVMNTFEILFRTIQSGFLISRAALTEFVAVSMDAIAKVFDALGRIPGPTQDNFNMLSQQLKNNATLARRFAHDDLQAVINNVNKIGTILKTGEGDWSNTFDELKGKSADFFNSIMQGNANILADTTKLNQELLRQEDELRFLRQQIADEDFMLASTRNQEQINLLKFYQQEFMIAHQGMAAFVLTLGQTIQTNLSGAITNIIMGAKTAKEAFAEFGKAMIQAIVNFMAQKLVAAALEKTLLATTVAASVASGAAVAAAWAPAAAMVSLATLGANAGPAAAALVSVNTLSSTLAAVGAMKGKVEGVTAMADGGSGVVSKPTLFLAGEAGPEKFNFTPMRGGSGNGGDGSPIEVNIYIQSANLSSGQDISAVGEDLGIRTARALRTARS